MSEDLIQEIYKMHADDRRVRAARRKFMKTVKAALDTPPSNRREVLIDRAIKLALECRYRLPWDIP
jgi:hypothetical protein